MSNEVKLETGIIEEGNPKFFHDSLVAQLQLLELKYLGNISPDGELILEKKTVALVAKAP